MKIALAIFNLFLEQQVSFQPLKISELVFNLLLYIHNQFLIMNHRNFC